MTRIAFVADPHIGNHKRVGGQMLAGLNDRCRFTLDSLFQACKTAHFNGCSTLYIIGDLYDNVSIGARIIAATQDLLAAAKANGLDVVISTGNHDSITGEPGDHVIGPLRFVARIVDKPIIDRHENCDVVVVPYKPGPAAVWLRQALSEVQREDSEFDDRSLNSASNVPSRPRILAVHLGIAHEGTPAFMQDECSMRLETLQNLLREFSYSALVAGHWHDYYQSQKTNPMIIQLGALAPTGWDNPGVRNRGVMAILDGTTFRHVTIPGPRFVKAVGQAGFDGVKQAVKESPDCKLFVEWVVAPDEAEDARADLAIYKDRDMIHYGLVVADTTQATEEARKAATAARSAATLAESLEAYVTKLALPVNVTRERVLELARRFMGLSRPLRTVSRPRSVRTCPTRSRLLRRWG